MTRKESARQNAQEAVLLSLGFNTAEADQLRRISMTLRRWHELECGNDYGCIERDETTGKAYWLNSASGKRYPTPDRESGAKRRLAAILLARNKREVCADFGDCPDAAHHTFKPLDAYIQTDPRGAALYILRPGDVPEGKSAEAYYTRGICIY